MFLIIILIIVMFLLAAPAFFMMKTDRQTKIGKEDIRLTAHRMEYTLRNIEPKREEPAGEEIKYFDSDFDSDSDAE